MAHIKVIAGYNPGQVFALDGACSVLGRHPSCDIVLEVGAVSRQHAQILRVGEDYFVEDLGSRNGTFLNGQAVQGKAKLNENDELKICDLTFTFHRTSAAPPTSEVTPPGFTWAEDQQQQPGLSTILSKIDVTSSVGGFRVGVNPEVKLKALMEITNSLAKSLDLQTVLPKTLESLFKVFVQADRAFIVLHDKETGALIPKAVRHRRRDDDAVRLSRTLIRQVMDSKGAILSQDASSDPRFSMSESIADFKIRSVMCAPLINSDGEALGVIQVDTLDHRSRFQQDDLEVLVTVATQAAFALENATLHENIVKQRALERDLALARQVQRGFLPSAPPEIPGYEFFHFYEPASQVGGDFFDYVRLPGNRLAVLVADVSGKGISAALLMAKVSAEARYLLASEASPAQAVNRLSAGFEGHGWDDRFVTFILAVIHCDEHEVVLVNAGHMPPFLRHTDGRVETVGAGAAGVPVGVDPSWKYEESRVKLLPGESLTAFTDGFSEAVNASGQMYGLEELERQVGERADNVQQLGQHILNKVKSFVGGYRQSDDMCLLCLGRTK